MSPPPQVAVPALTSVWPVRSLLPPESSIVPWATVRPEPPSVPPVQVNVPAIVRSPVPRSSPPARVTLRTVQGDDPARDGDVGIVRADHERDRADRTCLHADLGPGSAGVHGQAARSR